VELNQIIVDFIEKAREDPYIGPSHISVFVALVYQCNLQGRYANIKLSRKDVMCSAKISSIVTYFKCIKDLDQHNYLEYSPSTSGLTGSRITMNTSCKR
jgi:hypothetical protein